MVFKGIVNIDSKQQLRRQVTLQINKFNGAFDGPVNPADLDKRQYSISLHQNALNITARDPSGNVLMKGHIPLQQNNAPTQQQLGTVTLSSEQLAFRSSSPIPVISWPRKVVYIDYMDVDWGASYNTIMSAVDQGFNVINIAFYMSAAGAVDMCLEWQSVSQSQQISTMEYAHAAGAVVLVSAGGSTDYPYDNYPTDPAGYGTAVANWALQNNLDGIDFDLENLSVGFAYPSLGWTGQNMVDWMTTVNLYANSTMRDAIDPSQWKVGYITHAPQAPYFSPVGGSDSVYWAGSSGGYTQVYNNSKIDTGGGVYVYLIDFFNNQFYNQGTNYTTYDECFVAGPSDFPGTAIEEIAGTTDTSGLYVAPWTVPQSAQVFGALLDASLGSSGYVAPATVNTWMTSALSTYGFNSGAFVWFYQTSVSPTSQSWVDTVYPNS